MLMVEKFPPFSRRGISAAKCKPPANVKDSQGIYLPREPKPLAR